MADKEQPEELLSLTVLAKELGVSHPKLIALHACGIIKADAVSTQAILFKRSRLPELREQAKQSFGLERAIKANTARQRKCDL